MNNHRCTVYDLSKDQMDSLNIYEKLSYVSITPHAECLRNFVANTICHSCKTSQRKRCINMADDHNLCSECFKTAVFSIERLPYIVHNLRKFYRQFNLKVDKNIPIFLTDKVEMRKLSKAFDVETTHSMTVYGKKITTLAIKNCLWQGEKMEAVKEPKKLPKISILLRFGYPDVITGARLAHQMMNVWLGNKGCRDIQQNIKKGICKVMAYKWLDWYFCNYVDSSSDRGQLDLRYIQIYKPEIESNRAFRGAKMAVDKYGLKHTLKHIVNTRNLPNVNQVTALVKIMNESNEINDVLLAQEEMEEQRVIDGSAQESLFAQDEVKKPNYSPNRPNSPLDDFLNPNPTFGYNLICWDSANLIEKEIKEEKPI